MNEQQAIERLRELQAETRAAWAVVQSYPYISDAPDNILLAYGAADIARVIFGGRIYDEFGRDAYARIIAAA